MNKWISLEQYHAMRNYKSEEDDEDIKPTRQEYKDYIREEESTTERVIK